MFDKKQKLGQLFKCEQELKRCELMNLSLSERVRHLKGVVTELTDSQQKVEERATAFCRSLLNSVPNSGLETIKHANIIEMLNYTQKRHEEMLSQNSNNIKNLVKRLSNREAEVENLKAQVMSHLLQDQKPLVNIKPTFGSEPEKSETTAHPLVEPLKGSCPANSSSEERLSNKVSVADKNNNSRTTQTDKNQMVRRPSTQWTQEKRVDGKPCVIIEDETDAPLTEKEIAKRVSMIQVVDLANYAEKIEPSMWDILIAIGRDGYCESKDIEDGKYGDSKNRSVFNSNITSLVKMGLITREKISTGWRWAYIYALSETGKKIFMERFKTEPVKTERDTLIAENDNIMHGYCVKDASMLLVKACGYNFAKISRKENTIVIPEVGTYIPDIVATNDNSEKPDFFEVERGTCSQKELNLKCDKMRHVTQILYFIAVDRKAMNTIEKMISRYMLDNGSKLKGLKFVLTTMNKLSVGIWEREMAV